MQTFIINRSELAGRIDPVMALYRKRSTGSRFPLVRLGELLVSDPEYGANEKGIERESEQQPRYVRITDIDDDGRLVNQLGATAANVEQKYMLSAGDMLFARSGCSVGKTYLHTDVGYDCFFAGYLIKFRVDSKRLLPEYLFAYTQLQPYRDWVESVQRVAVQPNINAEEYRSLEIPLPPLDVQARIAAMLEEAYALKLQRLAEAKRLEATAEGMLRRALGLDYDDAMPADVSVCSGGNPSATMFTTSFRSVEGGRLDPVSVLYTGNMAQSKLHGNVALMNVAAITRGNVITSKDIEVGDVPVIAGGQTSPYSHAWSNQDGNVITVSSSGAYAGYVWYHPNPIFASDCCVVRSDNERRYSTKYLFEVMKLQQEGIYKLQQGAAQPHVYPSDLERLWIPEIDSDKQVELIGMMDSAREKANATIESAAKNMAQVKSRIERMLIED